MQRFRRKIENSLLKIQMKAVALKMICLLNVNFCMAELPYAGIDALHKNFSLCNRHSLIVFLGTQIHVFKLYRRIRKPAFKELDSNTRK